MRGNFLFVSMRLEIVTQNRWVPKPLSTEPLAVASGWRARNPLATASGSVPPFSIWLLRLYLSRQSRKTEDMPIYDITNSIRSQMPVYEGDPGVEIAAWSALANGDRK